MVTVGPLEHVQLVGSVLDDLDVVWALGGSLASSLIGEPRSTNDVDIALRCDPTLAARLPERFERDYFVSGPALIGAAEANEWFNLIHRTSSFKVDLFFCGTGTLDSLQLARRQQVEVVGTASPIWVTSPADVILRKLWWFRLGGEGSERQWRDVVSVLRVQVRLLDLESLREDADLVELADLVDRAVDEARR